MNARSAALLALLGTGLLLLTTTQPWLQGTRRMAPGLPSREELVTGSAAAPWVTAAALLGAAAVLLALGARRAWPLVLATLAAVVALAGTVLVGPGLLPGQDDAAGGHRDLDPTAWWWLGLLAALVGVLGAAAAAWSAYRVGWAGAPRTRPADRHDPARGPSRRESSDAERHEQGRRDRERAWRELDAGGDPTLPGG